MIPVRSPHAFDESLLSEDMLRSPVGGLGDRHAVPFASTVRHAFRDELVRHTLSGESLRDAQEKEMQRLACVDGPAML